MNVLLLSMSAHITKQLGMAPGGEFRAAYREVLHHTPYLSYSCFPSSINLYLFVIKNSSYKCKQTKIVFLSEFIHHCLLKKKTLDR